MSEEKENVVDSSTVESATTQKKSNPWEELVEDYANRIMEATAKGDAKTVKEINKEMRNRTIKYKGNYVPIASSIYSAVYSKIYHTLLDKKKKGLTFTEETLYKKAKHAFNIHTTSVEYKLTRIASGKEYTDEEFAKIKNDIKHNCASNIFISILHMGYDCSTINHGIYMDSVLRCISNFLVNGENTSITRQNAIDLCKSAIIANASITKKATKDLYMRRKNYKHLDQYSKSVKKAETVDAINTFTHTLSIRLAANNNLKVSNESLCRTYFTNPITDEVNELKSKCIKIRLSDKVISTDKAEALNTILKLG